MEKGQTAKRIARIVANILLYAFILIALVGVILTITAKKEKDGTATVFGMQIRYVLSPSMEKCADTDVSAYDIKDIPTRSMIFVETVPKDPKDAVKWYGNLRRGDVLTFRYVYVRQETITHRIIDIDDHGDGTFTFYLAGDNKNAESENLTQVIHTADTNSPNYVIGKVTGQSYLLGLFVSMLKSPVGIICVIILPSLAILVFEVIRIVNIFGADKKKKAKEERERQQSELDELRRRLAELESQSQQKDDAADEVDKEAKS